MQDFPDTPSPTSGGYLDTGYAAAMAMGGRAVALANSGGSIIVRRIPGSDLEDAISPYPFLVCRDWRRLQDDIRKIEGRLVTLTTVTDPLADVNEATLRESFHLVRPFKQHFVIDLTRSAHDFIDPHHLGCARRALKKVAVERCNAPLDHLGEWLDLYANLVRRHDIRGPARMTEQSFRRQFTLPGLSMFRARRDGTTIGMILCMTHGAHAYFHLGAYNEAGYRSKASYALVWSIITSLAGTGVEALSIGSGAGAFGDGADGLTQFKRGWGSGTRSTYLCGSILDIRNYERLAADHEHTAYFPAYRAGEFR